jgi:hypothetical protein
MKSKTKLKRLAKAALLAAIVLLTSCVTGCLGRPESKYPNDGILHLKKGDNYIAQDTETWYSLLRYQQCERDAINAAAALKQQKNH